MNKLFSLLFAAMVCLPIQAFAQEAQPPATPKQQNQAKQSSSSKQKNAPQRTAKEQERRKAAVRKVRIKHLKRTQNMVGKLDENEKKEIIQLILGEVSSLVAKVKNSSSTLKKLKELNKKLIEISQKKKDTNPKDVYNTTGFILTKMVMYVSQLSEDIENAKKDMNDYVIPTHKIIIEGINDNVIAAEELGDASGLENAKKILAKKQDQLKRLEKKIEGLSHSQTKLNKAKKSLIMRMNQFELTVGYDMMVEELIKEIGNLNKEIDKVTNDLIVEE